MNRPTYEISYALYVDGKPTIVELVGTCKSDAYKGLAEEWQLCYNDPLPAKGRCKLVEIERVRWG